MLVRSDVTQKNSQQQARALHTTLSLSLCTYAPLETVKGQARIFFVQDFWSWGCACFNRKLSCEKDHNLYHMACVCSRYHGCSNWLLLGCYSPVMPKGRLQAYKTKAKSCINNNLLTSNVPSLQGKSKTSTLL